MMAETGREGTADVSGANSRSRGAGRGHRGRDALGRRILRGTARPGISQFRIRAHRGTGGGVLPDRRQGNPAARTDPGAGLPDRAGSDAVQGDRRIRRPLRRRLPPGQHQQDICRTPYRPDRRQPAEGPCGHRAGDRIRDEACRAAGAERGAARRLRGADAIRAPRQRRTCDRRGISRQGRRRQYRRRPGGARIRPDAATSKAQPRKARCSSKSKARMPWPKPSRCAVPK